MLLALNYVIAGLVSSTPSHQQVPYSYFRAQVTAGNVSEVTSTGNTIQGTFKKPVKPPGASGKPSTRFQTERPALGGDGLLSLLEQQAVVINAHPIETATPFWEQLLLGFGPTISDRADRSS